MTIVLTDLNTRLLLASAVAEEIQEDGSLSINPCYYNPIGFTATPTVITGGDDAIDAALVGTNSDGVIVAFRGTLPPALNLPSILDWLQDLLIAPEAVTGLPGMVHTGFANATTAIFDQVLAEVQAQGNGLDVYVTGHSKGAAMAQLAAYLLQDQGIVPTSVVSFACPNAGNSDFVSAYNSALPNSTIYTNYLDIVPWLPPIPDVANELATVFSSCPPLAQLFQEIAAYNYAPAGSGIFIDQNGTTYDQSTEQGVYDAELLRDLVAIKNAVEGGESGIASVAAAHSILCGGGYMNGIAGDVVCSSTDCTHE